MQNKKVSIEQLRLIPGVGSVIAHDLWNLGYHSIDDLKGQDPENIYTLHNNFKGSIQDKCMLYVFRCAVYFANTNELDRDTEKLKWWNWKDK